MSLASSPPKQHDWSWVFVKYYVYGTTKPALQLDGKVTSCVPPFLSRNQCNDLNCGHSLL